MVFLVERRQERSTVDGPIGLGDDRRASSLVLAERSMAAREITEESTASMARTGADSASGEVGVCGVLPVVHHLKIAADAPTAVAEVRVRCLRDTIERGAILR